MLSSSPTAARARRAWPAGSAPSSRPSPLGWPARPLLWASLWASGRRTFSKAVSRDANAFACGIRATSAARACVVLDGIAIDEDLARRRRAEARDRPEQVRAGPAGKRHHLSLRDREVPGLASV